MIELQFETEHEPRDCVSAPSVSSRLQSRTHHARTSSLGAAVVTCAYIAERVFKDENEPPAEQPQPRRSDPHDFTLISRLPPLSVLRSQALAAAKRAQQQASIAADLQQAVDAEQTVDRPAARRSTSSSSSVVGAPPTSKPAAARPIPRRPIEQFELMRAIEKKDLGTIMAARDQNFNLLVQQSGGVTPMLHCIRLGASHRDVAILLTGALSRFINNVDERPSKQVKATLRMISTNLKLAITAALSSNQTELLSSYLQCIAMSEGDKMLIENAHRVSLALRAGKSGRPVKTAGDAIRAFATAELRALAGNEAVASVEDYLGNATGDLIVLGLWNIVTDVLPGEALPLYSFARDDRLLKAFADRMDHLPDRRKLSKLVRFQIEATLRILEPRQIGYRERINRLAKELDE